MKMKIGERPALLMGGIAYVPVKSGDHFELARVDKNNINFQNYSWSSTKQGYARARVNGSNVLMHWLAIGKPVSPLVTDHIDRDKLNNQLSNLRHVTVSHNNKNREFSPKNTSGYRGVSYSSNKKQWFAYISVNNKTVSLGVYDHIADAIAARKNAEDRYGL